MKAENYRKEKKNKKLVKQFEADGKKAELFKWLKKMAEVSAKKS